MKKIYAALGGVILLSSLLYISSGPEVNAGEPEALSEMQLTSAREDLVLWNSPEVQASPELKEKIAKSVVRKIMLVRSVSPNIDEMKAEALETLCLLAKQEEILGSANDPELAALAKGYLESSKHLIVNKIRDLQKNMKGTGCFVSPNP
jgi:hypothetical protein